MDRLDDSDLTDHLVASQLMLLLCREEGRCNTDYRIHRLICQLRILAIDRKALLLPGDVRRMNLPKMTCSSTLYISKFIPGHVLKMALAILMHAVPIDFRLVDSGIYTPISDAQS